ncbi:hypothetical protein IWX90DRAFT_236319 [Phyllosticta citrichinensis]|uniref:E3 ubiquitin-protein ligase n=1 Tax=Phyllosticta citrichinensis TaxID=1130410 RepID=A0ABR1XPQ0_9PEZI
MASSSRAAAGMLLSGAPDTYIGSKSIPPASRGRHAMQLELTQDVLDELITSIRNGTPPKLLLGHNPVIQYGDTKHILHSKNQIDRPELYMSNSDSSDDDEFQGLVSRFDIHRARDNTAGFDAALATFKNNMAAMDRERESKMVAIADAKNSRALTDKKRIPKKLAPGVNVFGAKMGQSRQSSPSLAAASPLPGSAPTSAPPSSRMSALQKAIKVPVLHILAIKPAKSADLHRTTRAPKQELAAVLQKIATENKDGEWELTGKSYKELDVWTFPYRSQDERQAAIDNAIRAFDKQRLSPEEKIWQMLLPLDERGKGKTLSRLTIGKPREVSQKTTPTVGPLKNLKKMLKAPAKKVEPKKRKAEESKESAVPKKRATGTREEVKEPARKSGIKTVEVDKETAAPKRPLAKSANREGTALRSSGRETDGDKPAATQRKPTKAVPSQRENPLAAKPAPAVSSRDHQEDSRKAGTASQRDRSDKTNGSEASAFASKSSSQRSTASNAGTRKEMKTKKMQSKINERPFTSTKRVQDNKPKNPSPLGASPPTNASDLGKDHPMNKKQFASSSTNGRANEGVAPSLSRSDVRQPERTLKRKANELDGDSKADVSAKPRKPAPAAANGTSSKASASTMTTDGRLKRKSPDPDTDASRSHPSKRLVAPTKPASNNRQAPTQTPTPNHSGSSSVSSTSSSSRPLAALSARVGAAFGSSGSSSSGGGNGGGAATASPQSLRDDGDESPEPTGPLDHSHVVEMSALFKKYYTRYYDRYQRLADREEPPTEAERREIETMHRQLVQMKREIYSGVQAARAK